MSQAIGGPRIPNWPLFARTLGSCDQLSADELYLARTSRRNDNAYFAATKLSALVAPDDVIFRNSFDPGNVACQSNAASGMSSSVDAPARIAPACVPIRGSSRAK